MGTALLVLVSEQLYLATRLLGSGPGWLGMGTVALRLHAARVYFCRRALGLFTETSRRVIRAGLFPEALL